MNGNVGINITARYLGHDMFRSQPKDILKRLTVSVELSTDRLLIDCSSEVGQIQLQEVNLPSTASIKNNVSMLFSVKFHQYHIFPSKYLLNALKPNHFSLVLGVGYSYLTSSSSSCTSITHYHTIEHFLSSPIRRNSASVSFCLPEALEE